MVSAASTHASRRVTAAAFAAATTRADSSGDSPAASASSSRFAGASSNRRPTASSRWRRLGEAEARTRGTRVVTGMWCPFNDGDATPRNPSFLLPASGDLASVRQPYGP